MKHLITAILSCAMFFFSIAATDSVIIKCQLTGNCNLGKFTLRGFDLLDQVAYHVALDQYGSFSLKVPYTGARQYTLAGSGIRYDFLVNPSETTYRLGIECKESGEISLRVDDSRENEAFTLMGRVQRKLVEDCRKIAEKVGDKDSCRKIYEEVFSAHNYNLEQIAKDYKGTFVVNTMVPACRVPQKLGNSGWTDSLLSSLYTSTVWNSPELYGTDISLSIMSLAKVLDRKLNPDKTGEWVKKLLDGGPSNPAAAKYYQQALFEYIFYQTDEPQLLVFSKWAEENKSKIANEVLKMKLSDIRKILPGSKLVEVGLTDVAGNQQTFSNVAANNNNTLLMFWSPNCSHCREEMPYVDSLYKLYKKKGFEVFSVAIDCDTAEWRKFVTDNKLNWINVHADEEAGKKLGQAYVISYTPTFVLVDKQGVIQTRFGNILKVEELLAKAFK